LNIRAAHWANHVRPQRWAKNPPGKKEEEEDFSKVVGTMDVVMVKIAGEVFIQAG